MSAAYGKHFLAELNRLTAGTGVVFKADEYGLSAIETGTGSLAYAQKKDVDEAINLSDKIAALECAHEQEHPCIEFPVKHFFATREAFEKAKQEATEKIAAKEKAAILLKEEIAAWKAL